MEIVQLSKHQLPMDPEVDQPVDLEIGRRLNLDFNESPERVTSAQENQSQKNIPIFMIMISILQAMLFHFGSSDAFLELQFDPYRRHQLWRFLTAALVHTTSMHLWVNIGVQLLFGCLFEIFHGWERVGTVYICGAIGGTLAHSILNPKDYGLGASNGGSAVITAYIVHIILNCNKNAGRSIRLLQLLQLIFLTTGTAFYLVLGIYQHFWLKVQTNYAGHFGGGLIGFLVAILFLKKVGKRYCDGKCKKVCAALIVLLLLVAVIINLSFPSNYYPTEINVDYKCTLLIHIANEDELEIHCEANPNCKKNLDMLRNGTLCDDEYYEDDIASG